MIKTNHDDVSGLERKFVRIPGVEIVDGLVLDVAGGVAAVVHRRHRLVNRVVETRNWFKDLK